MTVYVGDWLNESVHEASETVICAYVVWGG